MPAELRKVRPPGELARRLEKNKPCHRACGGGDQTRIFAARIVLVSHPSEASQPQRAEDTDSVPRFEKPEHPEP